MKKKLIAVMAAALLFCLCACAPSYTAEEEVLLPYDRYDLNAYMKPIWQSGYVYNETCMFVGESDTAPLLYRAEEILSVRSYDLKTEYEEGADYVFKDNAICRLEGGRIASIPEDIYYPLAKPQLAVGCNVPGKDWLLLMEGDYFCSRQICVTYRHAEEGGFAPRGQSEKFSRLLGKMERGETVTMVFYGDSITAGANSSGFIGCEPFAPVWAELVAYQLAEEYGYEVNVVHKGHTDENADLHALKEKGKIINFVNTAYGGMTTQWGAENLERRVNYYDPDFVAVGFGMNDASMLPAVYGGIVEEIVGGIRGACAEAEILLVSPMLPNPEAAGFYGNQPQFEEELIALCESGERIGCAPVTSLHEEILRVKRYYDMTGNNVNHPNDFLARLYAQTVLQAICGNK